MDQGRPTLQDNVNSTKQKVRGASEPEGAQHQLNDRLDYIEGDVHRCLNWLQRLHGSGLGAGNPGAHPMTHHAVTG